MLKVSFIVALVASVLMVGCGPSRMQQIRVAQDNHDRCESVFQEDEDLRWAHEFLGNNAPTPSMMVDSRYPTQRDMEIMIRWMDVDVGCSRDLIQEASVIPGMTSDPYWPSLLTTQSAKEDLYVTLLSGKMSYGQYFVKRRDLADGAKRTAAEANRYTAEAQRRQQARAAQAWTNAFQEMQKSFQNQPSIGSAFEKEDDSMNCVSWVVGNSVNTRCD